MLRLLAPVALAALIAAPALAQDNSMMMGSNTTATTTKSTMNHTAKKPMHHTTKKPMHHKTMAKHTTTASTTTK